jgi:hypothetical protein
MSEDSQSHDKETFIACLGWQCARTFDLMSLAPDPRGAQLRLVDRLKNTPLTTNTGIVPRTMVAVVIKLSNLMARIGDLIRGIDLYLGHHAIVFV